MTAIPASVDGWWLDWFRTTTLWSAVPMTRTYRCAKCDVTETFEASAAAACWSCGSADALVDA